MGGAFVLLKLYHVPRYQANIYRLHTTHTYTCRFPFLLMLVTHLLNKFSLYDQPRRELIFELADDPNTQAVGYSLAHVAFLNNNVI